MAALLLAGCNAKIDETVPAVNGSKLTFTGGFDVTRTAFTQKADGTWPLVWTAGDAIGIFSWDMTSTSNVNIKANLLRNTAGQPVGIFLPVDEVIEATDETPEQTISIEYPESGTEKFFIYYPYNSKTDINVDDACVHGTIASDQVQDAVSDKQIGKNGFSWAMAEVGADHNVNFTLTHAMAYLRFVVKTTDFADSQLHSVQVYDKKGKAALAGGYKFNPATGTLAVEEGKTVSSVKVTVKNDDFQAPVADGQELYMTILPGDFTAAEFGIAVCFIKADGTSITIPMDMKNIGNVPAASMTTVELTVNKSSNAYAWYEPEEPRYLANGWAYGPQNTYFVECKPKGEGNTQITIDVKARGDFSKVREPKYYGWLCSCEMSTRKLMQMTDGTTAYESVPTHAIGSDYKVTVECLDQNATGRWAVLGIYDADFNIIWSFMFMRYLTADPPTEVAYPGTDIVLLDRNLGASFSNKYAAETMKKLENSWAYFQWGRKDPFMWSNSGLAHYTQQLVNPAVDFEYAVNHPTTIFGYASGTDSETGEKWNSNGNWYVGPDRMDLWGAPNYGSNDYDNSLVGKKTIYDPCPKGYRVPDGKVLSTVNANGLMWERAAGQKNQDAARVVADNPFTDASVLAYPLGNDQYDYWPYAGAHWGSNGSWGNRTSSNSNHAYIYWSNSFRTNHRAGILEGCYFSAGWSTATNALAAQGFAVRCQKDEFGK